MLAGRSDDRSQPAPKAIRPAASGFPSVRRRTMSGADRAASAADDAVEAAVSRAAEAFELTVSPMLEDAEPAVW